MNKTELLTKIQDSGFKFYETHTHIEIEIEEFVRLCNEIRLQALHECVNIAYHEYTGGDVAMEISNKIELEFGGPA